MMLDLSSSEAGAHTLAGLPSGPGLVDLIAGKANFTSIVTRDTQSSAHIVRLGMNRSADAVALLTQKLDQILQTLNGIYDTVFINAGELSSSAQIMAGKVQAALLLAPAVRQHEVAMAVQALKASGMNAVEFVALVQGVGNEQGSYKATA
jgi:Mrp family chromosome partitioning ATPase